MEPRKELRNKKVLRCSKVLVGAVDGIGGLAGGEVAFKCRLRPDPRRRLTLNHVDRRLGHRIEGCDRFRVSLIGGLGHDQVGELTGDIDVRLL